MNNAYSKTKSIVSYTKAGRALKKNSMPVKLREKPSSTAQNISHEILVKEHQGNESYINQALDIKRELMHEIRSSYIQSQMEQFLQDKKDRLEYVPEIYPNRQFSLPDGLDPRKDPRKA